jgi:hypothetical protein
MAFHVIHTPSDLTAEQRREARRTGPFKVLARREYPTLLRTAGLHDVAETDMTGEYAASLRALLDWSADRSDDLRAVLGDELFEERQRDRRLQLRGVEAGVLGRSLFVATAALRTAPGRVPV